MHWMKDEYPRYNTTRPRQLTCRDMRLPSPAIYLATLTGALLGASSGFRLGSLVPRAKWRAYMTDAWMHQMLAFRYSDDISDGIGGYRDFHSRRLTLSYSASGARPLRKFCGTAHRNPCVTVTIQGIAESIVPSKLTSGVGCAGRLSSEVLHEIVLVEYGCRLRWRNRRGVRYRQGHCQRTPAHRR